MPAPATFPRGCVASPHHLASQAGADVLAGGGNAIDAALAANLVLAVVTPYHCGAGGDLFALVWDGERLHGYNGSGRAPAAAGLQAVRAAAGAGVMPQAGALTVTVPGAVAGWFDLAERFATRDFAALSARARELAAEGFEVSDEGAGWFAGGRAAFGADERWREAFGAVRAGYPLRQPDLARALERLAADGAEAFYRGAIGASVAACVRERGGLLEEADLAAHAGEWVEPLTLRYGTFELVELPPNSQGMTAQLALGTARAAGGDAVDDHVLVEAMKLALADRDAHLTDPAWMDVSPAQLLDPGRLSERSATISPGRAASMPRPGRPANGGTAYLCAADARGLCVSLIQSNFVGFGSGLLVPGFGIGLHNRGAYFSLDPEHRNAIAPRKRTLHTLMPAMLLRDGRPRHVLGTMGADAQPSIQVQLVHRLVDRGEDVATAVSAPRWAVSPADGSLTAESAHPALDALAERGHRTIVLGELEHALGHAHAIEVLAGGGFAGAADPRTESGVAGPPG